MLGTVVSARITIRKVESDERITSLKLTAFTYKVHRQVFLRAGRTPNKTWVKSKNAF